MQNDEQRVSKLFDFWTLVAVLCVFDCELVQVELLLHFGKFFGRCIQQRDPDKAAWAVHVVADVGDGDICQIGSVLLRDAVDQYEGCPWLQ